MTRKRSRGSRKKPKGARAAPFGFGFTQPIRPRPTRKTYGESFFERIAPVTIDAEIDSDNAWRQWALDRGGSFDSAGGSSDNRRRIVEKLLIDRGVDPHLAHQIAYDIDPDLYYMVDVYGYRASDPNDDGDPGDTPVKQAVFVGTGARVWSRLIGYATVAPIEAVDFQQIESSPDHPLWSHQSVTVIDGPQVYGHGNFKEWRDRQKVGRRKKAGGGMNAEERRKDRKAKNAAIKRKRKTQAKIDALKNSGDVAGAERLRAISKRLRKVIP